MGAPVKDDGTTWRKNVDRETQGASQSGFRHRRQSGHPRRRIWVRRTGVVMVLPLAWLSWSVGGVLLAPGTDTVTARLAEWARFHGMGGVVSELERIQYQLAPPKVGGALAGAIPTETAGSAGPSPQPTAQPTAQVFGVPTGLQPIASQTQPALAGEGQWQPLVTLHGKPAIQAAFLRPDALHTSYLTGVTVIDQSLLKMELHPGYQVPGGTGWLQPTDVPTSERDALVATFNSGFRMEDSRGGYWQDGQTGVPLRTGAASMVIDKNGHVDVVAWGGGAPGPDVVAVRQNLDLLVNNGTLAADIDRTTTATWGKTVGNATYVWRTALGIRADGSLVFVAGDALSVRTLATIARDAGAVRAMEMDINKAWTNFITYTHPSPGIAVPHMLTADEQPNPSRYLQPSTRDFVAVLAR